MSAAEFFFFISVVMIRFFFPVKEKFGNYDEEISSLKQRSVGHDVAIVMHGVESGNRNFSLQVVCTYLQRWSKEVNKNWLKDISVTHFFVTFISRLVLINLFQRSPKRFELPIKTTYFRSIFVFHIELMNCYIYDAAFQFSNHSDFREFNACRMHVELY